MGQFNRKNAQPEFKRGGGAYFQHEVSIPKPQICAIDLLPADLELLKSKGFNVFEGTLGTRVKVPNESRIDSCDLLANHTLPENFHEFDITILNLDHGKVLDYNSEDHTRKLHTGKTAKYFVSSYPETLFDPRPFSSYLLGKKIAEFRKRTHLLIVFAIGAYHVDYSIHSKSISQPRDPHEEKMDIYSFYHSGVFGKPRKGTQMIVERSPPKLSSILESYIPDSSYHQTFSHPNFTKRNDATPKKKYPFPLIRNFEDEVVGFIGTGEKDSLHLLYLPQLKLKGAFLCEFLLNLAPEAFPEMFPHSAKFAWKGQKEYWLPNHRKLLAEKEEIESEFRKKDEKKEEEIQKNLNRYQFLHEILSETGDNLVVALIKYFKWLGFAQVTNYDNETESSTLEEDIQVQLSDGLLIIECKGIGGTSTDSDCNQISKIRYRRCEKREKFDVSALYVVNHQRHQPPLNRKNPPFSEDQIKDASLDKRGLVSTWQLFNAFFDIENGIIEKSFVREQLLSHGLVDFRPKDLVLIDKPDEILKEGKVCIVNVPDIEIKPGEEILIEKNGTFSKNRILEMKDNDKAVSTASNMETGLLLEKPIKRNSTLWKRI